MKYFKIFINVIEGDDRLIPGSEEDPNRNITEPTLWFRLEKDGEKVGIGVLCTDTPLEEAIAHYIADVYKLLEQGLKDHKNRRN